MKYHARCLAHSSPPTPNRGTNKPFAKEEIQIWSEAWWFILTVRINYRATCLTHSRVATPKRGTNIPFLSIRNTNLDYKTNAWSFFLLGVATLECVRHQARWFILTVRLIYRAR